VRPLESERALRRSAKETVSTTSSAPVVGVTISSQAYLLQRDHTTVTDSQVTPIASTRLRDQDRSWSPRDDTTPGAVTSDSGSSGKKSLFSALKDRVSLGLGASLQFSPPVSVHIQPPLLPPPPTTTQQQISIPSTPYSAGHPLIVSSAVVLSAGNLPVVTSSIPLHSDNFLDSDFAMAGNHLAPEFYHGLDSEQSVEDFVADFELWSVYRKLVYPEKLGAIVLFLKDSAKHWYASVAPGDKDMYAKMRTALITQFKRDNMGRWRDIKSLWGQTQGTTESVEHFITEIEKKAL